MRGAVLLAPPSRIVFDLRSRTKVDSKWRRCSACPPRAGAWAPGPMIDPAPSVVVGHSLVFHVLFRCVPGFTSPAHRGSKERHGAALETAYLELVSGRRAVGVPGVMYPEDTRV